MRKPLLVVAALLSFANSGLAQDKHTQVTPETVIWKDNPAFPKGVQVATLVGDPSKAGDAVVLRIKFPPNFQMPPHTHPYSEVVTIISGAIGTSGGEKFEKKGELLKPGALWVYPAKHKNRFSKFSSPAREVLTTSTRQTIRARNSCRRLR